MPKNLRVSGYAHSAFILFRRCAVVMWCNREPAWSNVAFPFFTLRDGAVKIGDLLFVTKKQTMTRSAFFGNLDFNVIARNPEFKEASVRSAIINPILARLGYSVANNNLVEEKTVYVKSFGSKKQITPYFADYALKVRDYFVSTLETKAPNKKITDKNFIEQAFQYAIHEEIRSNYFILCNGLEFSLYKTDINRTLLLHYAVVKERLNTGRPNNPRRAARYCRTRRR